MGCCGKSARAGAGVWEGCPPPSLLTPPTQDGAARKKLWLRSSRLPEARGAKICADPPEAKPRELAMHGVRKAAGLAAALEHPQEAGVAALPNLHGLAAARIRSTQTTVRQYCTDGCVYRRSCATRDSSYIVVKMQTNKLHHAKRQADRSSSEQGHGWFSRVSGPILQDAWLWSWAPSKAAL